MKNDTVHPDLTTVRLLNRWKVSKHIESDYRAAATLKISPSTISGWRKGRSHAAPSLAARMAEESSLDVLSVLAAIEADRAHQGNDRRVWQKFGREAFTALMTVGLLVTALPMQAGTIYPKTLEVDRLCELRPRRGPGSWRRPEWRDRGSLQACQTRSCDTDRTNRRRRKRGTACRPYATSSLAA